MEEAPDTETYAVLYRDARFPTWRGVPVVAFAMYKLDGLDKSKTHELKLTVFECDYLADGALDAPNTQALGKPLPLKVAKDPAGGWLVKARPEVQDASPPDFYLMLGTRTVQARGKPPDTVPVVVGLSVPAGANFHDEDEWYDLGFVLEGKALAKYDRREQKVVTSHGRLVPSRDPVDPMLELAEKVPARLPQHDLLGPVLGRFNGEGRNPKVEPDRAAAELDREILAKLAASPDPVDADGLRVKRLIDPASRRAAITALLGTLTPKVQPGTFKDRLKGTDIQKAYFLIHDVGVPKKAVATEKSHGSPHYTSSPTKENDTVSGYVNHDGTYGARAELFDQAPGALHLWTAPWRGYALGFETVPIILDAPSSDRTKYPMIGRHAYLPGYWHWTQKLLDLLADLYVLASLRANHLLTVTCHIEADRNLMTSRRLLDVADAAEVQRTYDRAAASWAGSAEKKRKDEDAAAAEAKAAALDKRIGEIDKELAAPADPKLDPKDVLAATKRLTAERTKATKDSAAAKTTAKALRAYRPKEMTIWTSPGDMHGDPYGFDPQVLYDLITARLTKLSADHPPPGGAPKLTPGKVRYGINPDRVATERGTYPRSFVNGGTHLHAFPHQSAPTIASLPSSWKTQADGNMPTPS